MMTIYAFMRCSVTVLVGLLLCVETTRDEPEVVTLSLATWGAGSHPHEKEFVERFIASAVRNSGGRLGFKYFPNGSMVKQDDVVSSVPGGLVDIALMIIDSWAGIDHDVSIAATPLWTLSMQQARERLVPGQPLFDYFSDKLRGYNAKLLCLFDIGPPVIASGFPLVRPQDIKGKIVRALSKGSAQDLRALGSSPIVMGVGQVYAALQRRTVDGAMNGIQGSIGLRYYEVAGYEIATGGVLGTIISGYIMNLEKFQSLPPNLQQAIVSAAEETRRHTQDALIETYPKYLVEARKRGVHVFEIEKDGAVRNEWNAALASYRNDISSSYPEALLSLMR
jgi:TRAP-type C4-dicarboxylate transport system substrate-binding protein